MNLYKQLRYNYKTENGDRLTIRQLEKKLGIARSHISEIENGVKKPSLNEMKRYKEFFGVSFEYLINEGADGIVANKEDVRYSMSTIQKAETDEEIILKQTVEMLFGTEPGKTLLYQLSEILFGVENYSLTNGKFYKDENNEMHIVMHESIEKKAKQLANEFILLRDPKFRNSTRNEMRLIAENVKNTDETDEYSKKCVLA